MTAIEATGLLVAIGVVYLHIRWYFTDDDGLSGELKR